MNFHSRGIPTLSIDYAGRRQVFTEDKSDAYRYDKIYQLHKHTLASERSLNFIPVANSKVEVSGCAQVKSVVENLNNAGNMSVFGIIDWDKKNKSTGNIFVVSEGVHYTTENIFLDPVIIAAVILHEMNVECVDLGLPNRMADNKTVLHVGGEVLESVPPKRLVLSWVDPQDASDTSRVTFEIEPMNGVVQLVVTHGAFAGQTDMPHKVSKGWPLVLSSMKSFLETGKPIDIMAVKGPCGGTEKAA